jgi:hypothetical protein
VASIDTCIEGVYVSAAYEEKVERKRLIGPYSNMEPGAVETIVGVAVEA